MKKVSRLGIAIGRRAALASLSLILAAGGALAQPTTLTRLLDDSAILFSSPSISADGRFVLEAFAVGSSDSNSEVFVIDRTTGTRTVVSRDSAGNAADDSSFDGALSSDGRYAIFTSNATNLVANDVNNNRDLFLHDLQTGITTALSDVTSSPGVFQNFNAMGFAGGGSFGYYTTFIDIGATSTTTHTIFDASNGQSITVSTDPLDRLLDVSSDGRFVLFAQEPATSGPAAVTTLARLDRQTNMRIQVDTSSAGVAASGGFQGGARMSADGRFVAFNAPPSSNNLVSGDNNGKADVFLKDLDSGAIRLISSSVDGIQSNKDCDDGVDISADGRFVSFSCEASTIVFGDNNVDLDIFLFDSSTGGIKIVTTTPNGTQGNGGNGESSLSFDMSADGSAVAFTSRSTNLFAGDTNQREDLFLAETGGSVALDQCPSDTAKLLPGACGCGLSDADANSNGVADCNDPDGNTVPSAAPVLATGQKGKLTVTLPAAPATGVTFFLEIGRGAKVLLQKAFTGGTVTVKLPAGAVTARYRFVYPNGTTSQLSPAATARVKPQKKKNARRR